MAQHSDALAEACKAVLGVPPGVQFEHLINPRFARVDLFEDGSFELGDESGTEALIIDVPDEEGDFIDEIAFDPNDPLRWWSRARIAYILGAQALGIARSAGGVITLVEGPADWILSGGWSVSILCWHDANPEAIFSGLSAVKCATPRLARCLEWKMDQLAAPRFSIEALPPSRGR